MAHFPPQPLPYLLTAEEMVSTMLQHIEEHRKLLDKIANTIQISDACFNNVVKPIVDLENAQSGHRSVITALKFCSTDKDLQTAANKADKLWDEYPGYKRNDMYLLVKAVNDRKEVLDYESQKLLNKLFQKYQQQGFGVLNEEQIQQMQTRANKINELSTEIRVQIQGDQNGLSIPIEYLKDVPTRNRKPSQTQDGAEFYSYRRSDYLTIMKHVSDANTRKRMLEGYHMNRISVAKQFHQILLLRDENARDLGFKNHAATKMPERFADSLEWVEDLLSSLEQALAPFTKAELEKIQTKTQVVDIEPQDFAYYSNLVDKDVKTDISSVAEYYPLYPTFHAMLNIFATCFQLKFDPLPQDQLLSYVWHDSVLGWAVWDGRPAKTGEFIGYLFADLVARPLKYKGYQSANLQPSFLKPDGTRVYPASMIMCAFPEGNPDTGSLLNYRTVSVMFHELGHSIHDLIARTKYAQFHGYNVALELCEGIGSMLQAFCWYPEIMREMSQHYTHTDARYAESWLKTHPGCNLPPEKIPDEILFPASTQGGVTAGSLTGSLVNSLFDIAVHNPPTREAMQTLDEMKLFKDINEKVRQRGFPSPSYAYLDSTLLVSGYDAGVYSYICSQLIGADILQSKFAKEPRSREAWDEFRRCILEHGGSRDEVQMLREYMGGRSIDPRAIVSLLQ